MLDKELAKSVKLPKNGKHIIAVIYHQWRTTNITTNEIKENEEFIVLADGKMEDNEYVFAFNHDGYVEVERIPVCGYKKEEDIDHDVYEQGDIVKTEWTYNVLDYVILNTQVFAKDGKTISDGEDIEEVSI